MDTHGTVLVAAALVCIGGPLLLGLIGVLGERRRSPAGSPASPGDGFGLMINSAVLYAVAFSLVFFIQELFLVLPKAFVPGLRPTLYHNNHSWEGDDPLAYLFQGTGALAIFVTAVILTLWLRIRPPRSANLRLFVIWMIFHGFFQSLPQVVVGAVHPGNDVGMALDYLEMGRGAKAVAALFALAAIAAIGGWLARPVLALATHPGQVERAGRRARWAFRVATAPALLSLPIIILMRVPGSVDQVAVVPVAEAVIGISWIQASAPLYSRVRPGGTLPPGSSRGPLLALAALFLIFHLILRPGIAFF